MKKGTIAFCLILIALAAAIAIKPLQAQTTPTVSIDPTILNLTTTSIGQTIQININVTNVKDLWAWNFQDIGFNPNVLNITKVQEGPFLEKAGKTFFLWTSESQLAFSKGDIPEITDALTENTSVSGSGVLVTLTFQVIAAGSSPITFGNTTQLINPDEDTFNNTPVNGVVNVSNSDSTTSATPTPNANSPTPTPNTGSATPTPTSTGSATPTFDPTVNTNSPSNTLLYVGISVIAVVAVLATAVIVRRRK